MGGTHQSTDDRASLVMVEDVRHPRVARLLRDEGQPPRMPARQRHLVVEVQQTAGGAITSFFWCFCFHMSTSEGSMTSRQNQPITDRRVRFEAG